MHADHHETVAEALLERAQLLDDAQAVDAAEGPEIEHHDPPAQVAQRQWPGGVDPSTGTTELGCAHTSDGGRHVAVIMPRLGPSVRLGILTPGQTVQHPAA